MKRKCKLLFQGDSITDCGRDRSDIHNLGNGYPRYAAELLAKRYPDIAFEFINLGISGNCTFDLVARLESDFVEIQPDLCSILIGVNDTWHFADPRENWMKHSYFEHCYRTVLDALKTRTSAKILMMEQFLLPAEDKAYFREDLDPKVQITRKLAREYADAYLPTDGLLAAAYTNEDWQKFSADGVHPTAYGAEVIARWYVDAIAPLIEGMD
ncbi:MAG: SGNH/GDSL hydrolase family protein [Eubacteriales bacterium]